MFNIQAVIDSFIEKNASDLYITVGAPCSIRTSMGIEQIDSQVLTEEDVLGIIKELLPEQVVEEFQSTLEYNTAINWKDSARMRINLFRQRQNTGMVMRRIHTTIPSLEELSLPKLYGDLIMEKRGLILVVGPTGAGKSTTLASMLNHRNHHGTGHIVTVEDPVEYLLKHNGCIITQRDIGIDTYSFSIGLKNALRQAPDIIVIGEIRDRDAMEQAIIFAETGHLCLATLHANNTYQAIERIINFFPEEKHKQVLLNLSLNLKAIVSQRLVPNLKHSMSVALEIMLNQGLIKNLIHDGLVKEIHECIENGQDQGMQSFDQHLLRMFFDGVISESTALAEADNPGNMRLVIKQHAIGKVLEPNVSSVAIYKPNAQQQF